MPKDHKLKTERVNAGVIAECTGEGCDWSGKYRYRKARSEEYVEDSVFPNRQLAVSSHAEHHREVK